VKVPEQVSLWSGGGCGILTEKEVPVMPRLFVLLSVSLLVAGCATTQETKPAPSTLPAVVQPETIPGNFKITPQPLPPLEAVKNSRADGLPVYGLYVWAGEYRTLRDEIRKVGWKSFRFGGPWDDGIMRMVVEDNVEVMKTLGLRDIASGGTKKNRADYEADEPFIADYVAGIQRFLTRYGPNGTFFKENPGLPHRPVRYVEIWNEPNFQYMIPDRQPRSEVEKEREALYAKVLPAAYRAVKERWPEVTVVGFGAGGAAAADMRFIRNVFAADPDLIGRSFDILSTHPYVTPVPPEADSIRSWGSYSVAKSLADIRKTLAQHGVAGKPIWYTEVGWPVSHADGGYFPTPADQPFVSPLLQAAYVVRMYALAMRLGVERVHIMFATDTDNFNGGFFLRDRAWRPSAHAAKTMITLLPRPRLEEALADGADGCSVYRFTPDLSSRTRQSPVVMAWNVAGPKQYRLPWPSATAVVTDMLGSSREVRASGGTLSLEIGPCPVYVSAP